MNKSTMTLLGTIAHLFAIIVLAGFTYIGVSMYDPGQTASLGLIIPSALGMSFLVLAFVVWMNDKY